MSTTMAIIHIGLGDYYHSGIKTKLMVIYTENGSPYLNPYYFSTKKRPLFAFDLGLKGHLGVGPLSDTLRAAFKERGIVLDEEAEVRENDGRWYISGGKEEYQLMEDRWGINVLDNKNPEIVWKKHGGYNEVYVPHLTGSGDYWHLYHPITDLLLTFCIKDSKAAEKLKGIVREATGEENQDWIENVIDGVEDLPEDDFRVWKKWKDLLWDGKTNEDGTHTSELIEKARTVMVDNVFHGKIVVTLLFGMSQESLDGIKKNLEVLDTEIVLLEEPEEKPRMKSTSEVHEW